jgi:redox-sensitive bicupin YhaK (pirin superfamily)
MARISVLLALGLVLAVGVAGCAPEGGPEAANGAAPTRVDPGYDLDALLAALNAVEGVEVEVLEGEVEAPITSDLFDEAEVYALRVNRDPVYVYQFANQEAATVAAATVAGDASVVEGMPVEWNGTPHLYRAGRLIVVHISPPTEADVALPDMLPSMLGAEFAGGALAAGTPQAR